MAPDSSACSTSCSEADDINDVLCDMNRYLDGAISGNQKDPNGPSPPKRGRSLSPVSAYNMDPLDMAEKT